MKIGSLHVMNHYVMKDVLPGFIWIIPLKNNLYRIGLFSNEDHKKQDELLNKTIYRRN